MAALVQLGVEHHHDEGHADKPEDGARGGILTEILDGLIDLAHARKANAAGEEVAARKHHRRAQELFERLSGERASKRPQRAYSAAPAAPASPAENEPTSAEPALEPEVDLELGPDAMWFRVRGGEKVSMRRRHAMRRILLRLVEQWNTAPRQAVLMSTLIETGWPNERILADAAMNRLYNTIAVLRSLGLAEMLHSAEGGYALDPAISIRAR